MSPIEAAILRSIVLPSVLAGGSLLAAGYLPTAFRTRAQALILGFGFALGSYLLLFNLGLPPTDVNESFTYVALGLAAFPWVAPRAPGARYGARFVFALAGAAALLFHIRTALGNPGELRNIAAFTCLCAGAWSITDRARSTVSSFSLLTLPLVTGVATAVVLMIKGSAVFAQLDGVLCGLLGATLAAALIRPARVSLDAAVPFASAMIVFFMTAGLFYLDINPWTLVILAWPYAVLHLRSFLPVPRRAVIEGPALLLLAAVPVGAYVWHVVRSAGPLY